MWECERSNSYLASPTWVDARFLLHSDMGRKMVPTWNCSQQVLWMVFSNHVTISDSWKETFYIFLACILRGTVPLMNRARHSGRLCDNARVKLKLSRFLNVITSRYILNHVAFFPSSFIAAAASEAGDPHPGNLILSPLSRIYCLCVLPSAHTISR